MVSLFDLGEFVSNLFLIIYLLLAEELWLRVLVAPQHVGISWTRHWPLISCIGRPIPYPWVTREVPEIIENADYMVESFCWFDKLEISYIQSPTCLFLLLWSHQKHKNEPNPKSGLDTGADDMLWECFFNWWSFLVGALWTSNWWEFLSLPR